MAQESTDVAEALARGQAALATGAWDDAVRALSEAVAEDPGAAAAWESLGVARMWLQDIDQAIDARERAYTHYREAGDDLSSARVCLDLANDYLEMRGEAAVANGWLQRARRLLEGLPPSREQALLLIWDAYLALMGDADPATAEGHARDAAAVARSAQADDATMLALALQGLAMVSAGRAADGLSLLDEAVAGAIGGEFSDPQWFYLTCCCMIDACDRVRDYGRSLEWCDRLRAYCARWGVEAFLTTCRIKYTGALLWRGDWAGFEAELEHAMQDLDAKRPAALPGALVRLAELRRRQGRHGEAEAMLDRAGAHPLAPPVRAELALERDDPATARDLLEGWLRRTPQGARTERVTALEIKTRAHVALDQIDQASDTAAELETIAGLVGTDALRAAALLAAGFVASARGEHEEARLRFEDAAYLYGTSGSPYEAARARLAHAQTLADLDRSPAAATAAQSALTTFDAMGAAPAARRARRLLARLEPHADSPRSSRRHGVTDLTRRQREVLRLIAQGLSDRDIATRLYLSEHTVHRHVSNILTRLDVPSRTAAVATALRRELL